MIFFGSINCGDVFLERPLQYRYGVPPTYQIVPLFLVISNELLFKVVLGEASFDGTPKKLNIYTDTRHIQECQDWPIVPPGSTVIFGTWITSQSSATAGSPNALRAAVRKLESTSVQRSCSVLKDAAYWYSPGTIVDPLAYLPSHQYLFHAFRGRLYRGNEKISSWLCLLGSK